MAQARSKYCAGATSALDGTQRGSGEFRDLRLIKGLGAGLVLVGIGGGFSSDEYTLGDVVVATKLTDFSVSAALEGRHRVCCVGRPDAQVYRGSARPPASKTAGT